MQTFTYLEKKKAKAAKQIQALSFNMDDEEDENDEGLEVSCISDSHTISSHVPLIEVRLSREEGSQDYLGI